jgi:hypothetical protein
MKVFVDDMLPNLVEKIKNLYVLSNYFVKFYH